jgi:hypothetical protein
VEAPVKVKVVTDSGPGMEVGVLVAWVMEVGTLFLTLVERGREEVRTVDREGTCRAWMDRETCTYNQARFLTLQRPVLLSFAAAVHKGINCTVVLCFPAGLMPNATV